MSNKKPYIDVEYKETDNDVYLTAPQISQLVNHENVTEVTIRYWADTFFDLMGLEKINNRKRYKQSDVFKFAFLTELLEVKKFTHAQVREHISKYGFKYAEFNAGLVDPKDPLAYQALASAIAITVSDRLNQFEQRISENLEKNFTENVVNKIGEFFVAQYKMSLETKAEIESSVSDIMQENISKVIDSQNQLNQSIETKIDEQIQSQAQLQESSKADLKEFIAVTINTEIKESITEQVTNQLTSKLDTNQSQLQDEIKKEFNELKLNLDEKEQETNRKLAEQAEFFAKRMEERHLTYQKELEAEKNKGLFSRLFKK